MKRMLLAAVLLLLAAPLHAAVRYIAARQAWVLDTATGSYVLQTDPRQHLVLFHWGGPLGRLDETLATPSAEDVAFESRDGVALEEYPAFGGMRYAEPCLKVTFGDGVRDLVLRYQTHEIAGNMLRIRMRDIDRDVFVTLVYQVYDGSGIIRKQAVVENRTPQPIMVESAQSGVWQLPRADRYRLTYLAGRWGAETQVNQEEIGPGKKVLESRRGNTGHQMNPWFALDNGAGEESGEVWFGALGWSGNWKIVIEQTPERQVRVVGGFNDFDFGYPLQPGESLETPSFYGGYAPNGFGGASRMMHHFQLAETLPDRASPRARPVLYNSWYATEFAVDEAGQKKLADRAATLGVELFVIDDGWFGKRKDDHAGLGDWYVNKQKFPNGLRPLIDHVRSLGMKFGLWVEPEMVNPDSDLFRAHPDWAIQFPGRPRTEGRNQLVLNMAREDVREHIFGVLDRLLAENDIAFLKWDMNRHLSEPGWPGLPADEQKKIWVRYVRNVYDIIDRLRAKHPSLEIESCSGGGGRLDMEILRRTEQVWTSDNTEGLDRLRIQEGFTYGYSPKVMVNWITDNPGFNGRSTPLPYRFHVSMTGSLGIGGDLNKWSEADLALAARMVRLYKQLRDTVQQGSLYRLASPRTGPFTAVEYVSREGKQAVLFTFLERQQFGYPSPVVRLRGLDADAMYTVSCDEGRLAGKIGEASGSFLMNHGLRLRLAGDYDSAVVRLERK
jgi:alpha-galactosidase